jgi:hypothetical protein
MSNEVSFDGVPPVTATNSATRITGKK